ncbi:hypothetical protein PVAP13_5KG755350 [Panicum virgatum]|uniref:Uncharacterized protein n=1 Tax=Panicum virgatum TaxID=38727 RepID=A0A8T0SYP3_PANVG|nr:hypothetical protein PVAP13_5KG755350 [Panicum virgatum]
MRVRVTLAAALHPNSRPIVTGTDHHYALEHRHVTADTAVKAAGSTCQKSTPLLRARPTFAVRGEKVWGRVGSRDGSAKRAEVCRLDPAPINPGPHPAPGKPRRLLRVPRSAPTSLVKTAARTRGDRGTSRRRSGLPSPPLPFLPVPSSRRLHSNSSSAAAAAAIAIGRAVLVASDAEAFGTGID